MSPNLFETSDVFNVFNHQINLNQALNCFIAVIQICLIPFIIFFIEKKGNCPGALYFEIDNVDARSFPCKEEKAYICMNGMYGIYNVVSLLQRLKYLYCTISYNFCLHCMININSCDVAVVRLFASLEKIRVFESRSRQT